ncbi:MAG: hypothetical protein HGA98_00405 [Deltaproteobacteria bacterium]|nr:hypothetical protein [Deltaproteobacteria bacterium]
MYLTSVTQRDRLFDLATRWLADRPEPGDGRFATQLFVFESAIWGPTLRRFVSDVLRRSHAGPMGLRRLRSKDELRASLAASCGGVSPRARELFEQFRLSPDEFFPGTPTDLVLVTAEDGVPLAMVRVKRARRIAEKASRRVADALTDRIRGVARSLAAQRASALGVELDRLVSTPEAMTDDFARAERIVSAAFRDSAPAFTPKDLRVDDVIGAKFVGGAEDLARVERAITDHPLVAGVEREEHRGRYNDVNLLVDLRLPPPEEIAAAARGFDWSFAAPRGLRPDELARDFPAYVHEGARTIRAEVILTTPDELIESEFGRSIHEQRILEQRSSAPYSGRIAGNASFLIEYLLMLAISPVVEAPPLPVKMWGRYLPDIYALAVWDLFGIRLDLQAVHAFADPADAGPKRP